MEEPLIIEALRDKRAEIHGQIAAYQSDCSGQHDLAQVSATIHMFTDVECQRTRYIVSHGFFKMACGLNLSHERNCRFGPASS